MAYPVVLRGYSRLCSLCMGCINIQPGSAKMGPHNTSAFPPVLYLQPHLGSVLIPAPKQHNELMVLLSREGWGLIFIGHGLGKQCLIYQQAHSFHTRGEMSINCWNCPSLSSTNVFQVEASWWRRKEVHLKILSNSSNTFQNKRCSSGHSFSQLVRGPFTEWLHGCGLSIGRKLCCSDPYFYASCPEELSSPGIKLVSHD